jgi:hypothetical protein
MVKFKIHKLKCGRCGWEWVPRKKEIRICPDCKSPYWDLPPQPNIKLNNRERLIEKKLRHLAHGVTLITDPILIKILNRRTAGRSGSSGNHKKRSI